MLIPKRINYRRKAHHRNAYIIGSPECIKELYDRCIRDAEKEGKIEDALLWQEMKKVALSRAHSKHKKIQKNRDVNSFQM